MPDPDDRFISTEDDDIEIEDDDEGEDNE